MDFAALLPAIPLHFLSPLWKYTPLDIGIFKSLYCDDKGRCAHIHFLCFCFLHDLVERFPHLSFQFLQYLVQMPYFTIAVLQPFKVTAYYAT